ncbi:methyl-coenzyme M reductase operon protein D [Methanomassiliicoccus luminyensis]|uniref:McrD (methyl-coenzyme M reductase operon protein D) n=1 Tax=Methanomassiliicoccus luminyensis B10 TaxID=1175296 RepID=A0AAT8XUI9_9ARCH|nr:methyl-coenzyme M reductase operon protein D [Methanomassiliicoccus luminyensis]
MSTDKFEPVPLPEILIFPNRLLSAETTEKLLNRVYDVPHVRQVNISGEGVPAMVGSGPGKGLPVEHEGRKVINVKGREIELQLLVGRVFVEIDDIDVVEKAIEAIDEICQELLPFGYNLEVGRYSKYRPTVTDYKKGKR